MNKIGIYLIVGMLLLNNCTSIKQAIYVDFYKTPKSFDSTIFFHTQADSTMILLSTNSKKPIFISKNLPNWLTLRIDTLPNRLIAFNIKVTKNSENTPRHTILTIGEKRLPILQTAHSILTRFMHCNPKTKTIDIILQKDTHQLALNNLPINEKSEIIYYNNNDSLLQTYRIVSAIFKNEKNTIIDWWNYEEGITIGNSINIKDSLFLFAGGNGSLRLPYLVANPLQLNAVREKGCNPNVIVYFKQIKDIDLSDAIGMKATVSNEKIQFIYQDAYAIFNHQENGWIPIGNDDYPFTGYYDANNHTIDGLCIKNITQNQIGLFGKINPSATIKSLFMGSNNFLYNHYNYKDTAITYTNMGSIVGENNGTIIQCQSHAQLYSEDENNTGGIVGFNYGIIAGCTAKNILVNSYVAGGISGFNYGNISSSKSYNNNILGDITGGIVGYNSHITVSCHSEKDTIKSSIYAGSLAGYNSNTIIASYAINCNIEKTSTEASIGLLVGFNNYSGDMIGCYALTENNFPLIGTKQNETMILNYNLQEMTINQLFDKLFAIPYYDFKFLNPNGTPHQGSVIWKNSLFNYPILWWE